MTKISGGRISFLARLAMTAAIAVAGANARGSATAADPGKRCDWHGPRTTGETDYNQCIDYGAMQGKTIKIPSNVTRISQDGLSFCKNAINVGAALDADIVYMMDNSGSMERGDLVNGVRTNPGDPAGIRDRVIRRAMRQQRTVTNVSTAGFLSFVGLMENTQPSPENVLGPERKKLQHPLDISRASDPQGQANLDILLSKVWKHNPTDVNLPKQAATEKTALTYWSDALTLAVNWLKPDSGYAKTQHHAIILISDGAISDWPQVQTLAGSPGMPPVYGIHLGDPSEGKHLKDLTTLTGGKFFVVTPTDTLTFYKVMQNIVSIITNTAAPKEVVVTNSSQAPPQTSRSIDIAVNPDGSMGVVLDSIIGLKEGLNNISIQATPEGGGAPTTFQFTLDVSDPALTASQETYACYDMPTLTLLDHGQKPTIYSQGRNTYDVELTRSPSELSTTTVSATSEAGDREALSLPQGNSTLGYPVQDGKVTIDGGADPTADNGVVESNNYKNVILTWTHPRDSRETVTLLLPGIVIPEVDGSPVVNADSAVVTGVDVGEVVKADNPIVVVDKHGDCVVNCPQGTHSTLYDNRAGIPGWTVVLHAPLKYRMRLYDHYGQFVNSSEGDMSQSDFDHVPKDGDSTVVMVLLQPCSQDGRKLGTGVYLMRLEAFGQDSKNVTDSQGKTVHLNSAAREYFKKFGYVRNFGGSDQ